MKVDITRALLLSVLGLAIIFSFQNCSPVKSSFNKQITHFQIGK